MIKEKIETPEDAVSMMNKYLIIEDKEKETSAAMFFNEIRTISKTLTYKN